MENKLRDVHGERRNIEIRSLFAQPSTIDASLALMDTAVARMNMALALVDVAVVLIYALLALIAPPWR